MASYVLGIDGGTESIRTGVYDETGRCLSFGVSENKNYHRHPGWAEQKIEQWDESLVESIKIAIDKAGVDPGDIKGVGLDGTSCTVLFLDKDGRPLRDAIMWMDIRASGEAAEIAGTGDPALEYVGFGNVSPEWFPCKVLWTKRNEPDTYKKAHTIFEHTDWMVYRLTGEITANINTTTVRWFYNGRKDGFPTSLYETIGLGDVFEKLPSRIVGLGEVAGKHHQGDGRKDGAHRRHSRGRWRRRCLRRRRGGERADSRQTRGHHRILSASDRRVGRGTAQEGPFRQLSRRRRPGSAGRGGGADIYRLGCEVVHHELPQRRHHRRG